LGPYKRNASRFWWIAYTMNGEQYCELTKATSKELATKVWKKRESEIVTKKENLAPRARFELASLRLTVQFGPQHTPSKSYKSL
jgi:hypothetical protein